MSKYSTDELIQNLNAHFYPSPTGNSGEEYRMAIIARLRAADALCAAAKELLGDGFSILPGEYTTLNVRPMRRAIADYEEAK